MKILLILVLLFPLMFPYAVLAETDAERRARIEAELNNVERQILTQQRLVEDIQVERQSLERDLTLIESEITQAQLGVQARSAAIEQLSDQIGDKEVVLDVLAEKKTKQQASLADLVRKSAVIEDYTLVEVMLSKRNFSDFFSDVATFETLKASLNESLVVMQGIERDTIDQREQLTDKQQTEAEMRRIQELEIDRIEVREDEKAQILTVTRGEEQEYQTLLNSQMKTAAQLRSQLFDLLGGGGGIPFGEAVSLAQYASGVTGIDPAFILAILEQETNLGSNLGGCVFTDSTSQRPVMHPTRDEPVFLAIAEILGFDPNTRTVSCPLVRNGTRIGWGGAMGPSQFIPSTWAMYGGIVPDGAGGFIYDRGSDAIRAINGGDIANPFNNRDAFLATALLLRDNGADGTYAGDRRAALRYYAGWGGANNPANAFYGNQVMGRKDRLAGEIQILSQ
jgi:membrane-bound lytic murein transglycosylase B